MDGITWFWSFSHALEVFSFSFEGLCRQLYCKHKGVLGFDALIVICSFANNDGLCGVGLGSCNQDSNKGTKAGIIVAVIVAVAMVLTGGFVYWKRRANIARAQRLRKLSTSVFLNAEHCKGSADSAFVC